MQQTQKTDEKGHYPLKWFKERALNSFVQIDENAWDYSDSLLLYIPGTEKEYESMQETDTTYHKIVTQPERAYLEEIAMELVAELPKYFNYVDLGPGTEHKEQFIFDAAKTQEKSFIYTPVDISERFLKLSSEHATQQGIEVRPEQVPFEKLTSALPPIDTPRFVSLGLTYSNYNPAYILGLLKNISGKGGSFFITVQIRDRIAMEEVRKAYSEDAQSITNSKLELLGLNVKKDVGDILVDDGVRVWCTLRHSTPELEAKGILSGARLLIFQSLRYTKEALEEDLESNSLDYKLFDTDQTFIGALVKT
ncbi:MAG: hypothetical protein A2675_04095 [Candidatus Yonathbacteria bacterium RIFCSPHIGHO2_01_FULL_51_10]|uniref:Histidine-specific methyltransferase SAM-dependent domain-containing protein n=1 Tax=Candidatus Yonathbacteria bacterium RIFCSPHIGHO2_01_FULL_51_10 TaxID=1802723 RepID=A0A1G2S5B7_9BACT|nr:MAG: hypothetical protein A2675_04095 [Candidatus Yonathbacteria bacterium RIFCSPHIGHO2_01_FULL_51_10]